MKIKIDENIGRVPYIQISIFTMMRFWSDVMCVNDDGPQSDGLGNYFDVSGMSIHLCDKVLTKSPIHLNISA
jgi:hypothetical protein